MVDVSSVSHKPDLKRNLTDQIVENAKKRKINISRPIPSWKQCRENDLPARKTLLTKICTEMKKARPTCTHEDIENLKEAAKQIELALYEKADTREEYMNLSSLQTRIANFLEASKTNCLPVNHGTLISKTQQTPTPKRRQSEAHSADIVVKIRRRRLKKLFHASNCKEVGCNEPDCAGTKKLFKHVVYCEKEDCSIEKCVSTRYLLVHFRLCATENCAVCSVVKKSSNDKKNSLRKKSLFSNNFVQSSIASLTKIVSRQEKNDKFAASKKPEESKEQLIDKKYVRSCISKTGPNFLQYLTRSSINQHLRSLRTEKLQPIVFPVLRKLMEHKHNRNIFNVPVDADALNIPHYYNIISQPMDLGTIRQKLEDGTYTEFETFDSDIRLVFANAMKFNPPQHPIHIIAHRFLNNYEAEVEKIKPKLFNNYKYRTRFTRNASKSSKCNLCFQEKCEICPLCERGCLAYESRVIYCSGNCTARIQRNVYYYCTPAHTFCFCTDCVEKQKKKKYVEVQGGTRIKKVDLIKKKNNELTSEPWVSCDVCDVWCHQVCALYNPRKDDLSKLGKYICPHCLLGINKMSSVHLPLTKNTLPSTKREMEVGAGDKLPLKARDLPTSPLSDFIQTWTRKKYASLQEQEIQLQSKTIIKGDSGPPPESLIVRLTHNFEELCKIKPFAKISLDKLPDNIKYMSKCLILFQEIDGVDTLIFVMFVQEYGDMLYVSKNTSNTKSEDKHSDAEKDTLEAKEIVFENDSHPNRRKIYIAYLDSIHYLRPRRFRTSIYQTLMLAYLEYVRNRGFFNAYIWACPPPNKRDDYILHCHPEDQRVPNPDRLRKWYHKMAKIGLEIGVVSGTSSLIEEHFLPRPQPLVTVTKGRKSKKKAMEEIIAVNKKNMKQELLGKGKDVHISSPVEPDIAQGFPKHSTVHLASKSKQNKLALNQKMPYFDGDYWPQELEEIGKDEELKRKKTNDSDSLKDMSSAKVRRVLFARLSEQLNAMKQDFLVVKLAYECVECGNYVYKVRYECRHSNCILRLKDPVWDLRSKYVLCQVCYKVEVNKPVNERHGSACCKPELVEDPELLIKNKQPLKSARIRVLSVSNTHELIKVSENVMVDLEEQDEIRKSEFMETRHAFLALCSGNKYQFNQLRRAKASTMMVLYHLHNPKAPAHLYTCSKCQSDILAKFRYHCTKCNDFNLCETCYSNSRHDHKLFAFRITRGLKQSSSAEAERNIADSRRARVQSIQIYLHFIRHTQKCKDKECKLDFCVKIKSIIRHSKTCPKKNNVSACAPCRDLFILSKLHKGYNNDGSRAPLSAICDT